MVEILIAGTVIITWALLVKNMIGQKTLLPLLLEIIYVATSGVAMKGNHTNMGRPGVHLEGQKK